ncbi:MAG: hypothetical protein NVSMB51_03330 [Solirubrobacteraceae bacterium]
MRRILLLSTCSLALAAPAQAGVVPGSSIDGPSADIKAVGGVALAADSGGGVVYVKSDAGVAHVFVAILTHGVWSSPQRLDAGVETPASQPVIAAAPNGRLAVAFISGGTVYGVVRPVGAPGFGGPQALAPALSDPSLAMGLSGAAYLTWTAPVPGGTAVRGARLDRRANSFALLAAPVSTNPAVMPGSGPGRSRVALSADGTGLASWGEAGGDGRSHVLVRRLFGLGQSAAPIDLTVDQIGGHAGFSADSPVAGLQDDSSFAFVAFRQQFDNGGGQAARVVLRPLIGDRPQPPQTIDSLGFPAPEGSEAPAISIAGSGDGIAAAQLQSSHQVVAAASAGNGFTPGQRVSAGNPAQAPLPATAVSRSGLGIVAFSPDAGSVQGRLYDGGTPGEQHALSRPEFGPVDAAGGLSAAADDSGDLIVGYLQGDPPNHRVAVAAVVAPPASFKGLTSQGKLRTRRPTLSWEDPMDSWSAVRYTVSIDGKRVGSTGATEFKLPRALASGTHHWRVTASDSLGQSTSSPTRLLRIGGKGGPAGGALQLRISGSRVAGAALKVAVSAATPLKSVRVQFGDGAASTARAATHVYARAGSYTLTASATTKAGKRLSAQRTVQIK